MRLKGVYQHNSKDCGVACLAMILNYYDKKINYDNLKSEFKMDEVGTSAYEVIRVAKKHGLNAEGYKNFKINKSLHFPVIAHVVNNNLQLL